MKRWKTLLVVALAIALVPNIAQSQVKIKGYMFGDGFESNFKGTGIDYIPFTDNPGAPFNLLIAGVSWNVAKNVWFIPNIKYVFYGDPDEEEKPGENVYANFTIWFKF